MRASRTVLTIARARECPSLTWRSTSSATVRFSPRADGLYHEHGSTDQGLRRGCHVGDFYLSIEPVCRRPSVAKSTAYAGTHRSKTSKSVILGQRDNRDHWKARPDRFRYHIEPVEEALAKLPSKHLQMYSLPFSRSPADGVTKNAHWRSFGVAACSSIYPNRFSPALDGLS
jgi:hypothetical protein